MRSHAPGGGARTARGAACPAACSLLVLLVGLGLPATLGLPPGPGSAAAHAAEPQTIIAAVPADWPPEYLLEDGQPTGFAIDVLEAVARRAGFAVEHRVAPTLTDAFRLVASGEADLVPTTDVTAEDADSVLFTTPVHVMDVSLFVRDDSDARSLDDLRQRPVAVVEDNVARGILERSGHVLLDVEPDVHSALVRLLAGEVDALAYPRPVVKHLARAAGIDDRIVAIEPPLAVVERAIAVRRDATDLRDRLDRALQELRRSTEYQEIYLAWHPAPHPWSPRDVLVAAAALGLLLVLGLLLGRWIALSRHARELQERVRERDVAEKALRREEHRLRSITENVAAGIFLVDPDGRITYANPKACEITGYAAEELIGESSTVLLEPDEHPRAGERLKDRLAGRGENYQATIRRKDGTRRVLAVQGAPMRDDRGEVVGAIGSFVDVTERERTQQRLADRERALRQAQKTEAIGRLAGGVAHDFNNLLTVILGHARELAEKLPPENPLREDARRIESAAEQAATLTRRLLDVARSQALDLQPVSPTRVAGELRASVGRMAPDEVEIETDFDACDEFVLADRMHLEQVLVELAANACEAMPDGGRLSLGCHVVDLPDPALDDDAPRAGRRPERGRHLLFEIADTGRGMSPEALERLFEPFFTTRGTGSGAGLGLASAQGNVEQVGGSLEILSVAGEGTRARVFLPVAASDERPRGTEDSALQASRPRREGCVTEPTVLLVEDQAAVRDLVATSLRHRGYRVIEAESGDEALALATGDDAPHLDLVVTDIMMPGMRGDELARELERRLPALRVLFVSGYTDSMPPGVGVHPGRAFLAKPIRLAELHATVERLIEEDTGESA